MTPPPSVEPFCSHEEKQERKKGRKISLNTTTYIINTIRFCRAGRRGSKKKKGKRGGGRDHRLRQTSTSRSSSITMTGTVYAHGEQ